ncbi:MAG: 3-deoxy-8-phosphooctulonate synthase [Ignavibacteria bacterium GWF2_33_9]|nr:MAG: 3-deoxy-8-phosphooctulonate synthase [Ignavibacteria bacterium GWF2_33_9]
MKNKNDIFFIAGPCLAESKEMLTDVAEELKSISFEQDIDIIFKASYRKANRTSGNSFSGVGDIKALEWIAEIGDKYDIQTLTDIHSVEEAKIAAEFVDFLQIPAFLCRQTDLLIAAGETGKYVNIKKGQFVSADTVIKAAQKIVQTGNEKVLLTERGTFFGYNDLVVDFRSLKIMKESGFPVVYDATHSVQRPSISEQSGGYPEMIPTLAKAAVAVGVNGIFFETHPNPTEAKSDKETQLPLTLASKFISDLILMDKTLKELQILT